MQVSAQRLVCDTWGRIAERPIRRSQNRSSRLGAKTQEAEEEALRQKNGQKRQDQPGSLIRLESSSHGGDDNDNLRTCSPPRDGKRSTENHLLAPSAWMSRPKSFGAEVSVVFGGVQPKSTPTQVGCRTTHGTKRDGGQDMSGQTNALWYVFEKSFFTPRQPMRLSRHQHGLE